MVEVTVNSVQQPPLKPSLPSIAIEDVNVCGSLTKYRDLTKDGSSNLAPLRGDLLDVMKSSGELARAATRDGALDKKTKELMALALGVAAHCDARIGFHVQSLVAIGATKSGLEVALGIAVDMGRGPSLMYSASALAAYEESSHKA